MKGEDEKALEFYELIQFKGSKYGPAFTQMGRIYMKNPKKRDYRKAQKYLDESLEYDETPEVL